MPQNTFIEGGVSFAGESLKLNSSADAAPIIDAIRSCYRMLYLNLEGNSLGVDAAQAIGETLAHKPEFKKALWKDMFTGRLKSEIPEALAHLGRGLVLSGCRLTVLDISDNAMGPIGIEGLLFLIGSSTCYNLEELRMNNLGLGITGAHKLGLALETLYQSATNDNCSLKLRVFTAGRNRLENEGAIILAKFFSKLTTLEEFAVPQNGIYHSGIAALCGAFSRNTSLKVINLNDNTITPSGAAHLKSVLSHLKHLESLDLGDCLLKARGGMEIASAFKGLTSLHTVDLSANELSTDAGLYIINSLQHSCPRPSFQQESGNEDLGLNHAERHVVLKMDCNQFGDGVEMVKEVASAAGIDLGSLSNDEGESEEDSDEIGECDGEEESEDEDDDDEDEEDEEFTAEVIIEEDKYSDDGRGVEIEELNYQLLLEKFKNRGMCFKDLGPNNGHRIVSLLQERHYPSDLDRMSDFVKILIMVANIDPHSEDSGLIGASLEIITREIMSWTADDESKIMFVLNTMCAFIGFVKAEEPFPVKVDKPRVIKMLRNTPLRADMWRTIDYCVKNPTRR